MAFPSFKTPEAEGAFKIGRVFEQGYIAFAEGKGDDACPYGRMSDGWLYWTLGYNQAIEEWEEKENRK